MRGLQILLPGCHVDGTGQAVVAGVLVQWVKVQVQQVVWGIDAGSCRSALWMVGAVHVLMVAARR